jgi:hypothetical protein
MAELGTANLIDDQVEAGDKSGYNFATQHVESLRSDEPGGPRPASFGVTANALVGAAGVTQSGTRGFCMATDGVMWQFKPNAAGDAGTAALAAAPDAVTCDTTGGETVE